MADWIASLNRQRSRRRARRAAGNHRAIPGSPCWRCSTARATRRQTQWRKLAAATPSRRGSWINVALPAPTRLSNDHVKQTQDQPKGLTRVAQERIRPARYNSPPTTFA